MKKALFLFAAFAVILATGCKKEGCTNADATNYNADADDDDGTCTFEGDVVFWYGEAASNAIVNDGSTNLTFYVDGTVVGSTAANVFWTSAPTCGQNGSISVTKDLGSVTSLASTFEVKDQDEFVLWDGIVNFQANTCVAFELAE